MLADLQNHFSLENTVSLGTMSYPTDAGHIELNGIKIPGSPWTGSYFKNLPFELKAVAGLGYQFAGWSTAIFETIIEKKGEWKYLDDGSDQGILWRELNFNDNDWGVGLAELGYGDGDENTVLSYGNNSDDKYPTTYFRKIFTINNLGDYSGQLIINLLRDDGAVVYLNGHELFRSNMPTGNIDYHSYASDFLADPAENTFQVFSLQTDQLLEGDNILAVEVHQANGQSSDLGFDLELKALKLGQAAIFSMDELLAVNLNSDSFYVANYLPTGDCILPRMISENTILTIDCSPYLVPADVIVLENTSLVIEAGVELHFNNNTSLIINGDLQVQGTEDMPVKFKAASGVEKWGNLNFKFSADTSHLEWVEIVDASKGGHPVHDKAAVSAFYANLKLNHVKIVDVFNDPIFAQYSYVSLTNSQLYSKITGDLINVKYGEGFIENCDLQGNEQPDMDAIDFDEVTNGIIRNNKIYDFFGFNSDGIDLGEASPDVIIENNFIHNCTDKSISIGQMSSALVQHNTIVNCNLGLGIKDLGTADIDQNTFYNTAIPVACFEKNIGVGGGTAFVTNSIFSNSPESPFFADEKSIINISNTLSDTENVPGVANILGHPHFESPTKNNFLLRSNSAAIGAGVNDLGEVIDLGAKFHDFSAPPSVVISAIQYNPVSDPEAEFLNIYNPSNKIINLTGYVFSEAIDFIFPAIYIAPNETIWIVKDAALFPFVTEQIFTWTAGKLSNGGETIRLFDAHGIIVDQVIYDDAFPWAVEADGQGAYLSLISAELDNHFAESWESKGLVGTDKAIFSDADFRIFPNPVNDMVQVQSDRDLIEKVELFNLFGQKIMEAKFSASGRVCFNLAAFPEGVWVLKINGDVVAEKLLVVR